MMRKKTPLCLQAGDELRDGRQPVKKRSLRKKKLDISNREYYFLLYDTESV